MESSRRTMACTHRGLFMFCVIPVNSDLAAYLFRMKHWSWLLPKGWPWKRKSWPRRRYNAAVTARHHLSNRPSSPRLPLKLSAPADRLPLLGIWPVCTIASRYLSTLCTYFFFLFSRLSISSECYHIFWFCLSERDSSLPLFMHIRIRSSPTIKFRPSFK